jgi:hypothetical protein
MQRLLANYQIDDHADIKAGWASPSLLKAGRGGAKYHDVRANFLGRRDDPRHRPHRHQHHPEKLDASAWPGVPAVFSALVGALPKELA